MLARAGITANQVTLVACAASVALGLWLVFRAEHVRLFLVVPLWFGVRMALNAIDGMLAREFNQASRLGAYLNELTDVISDAVLYAPFALLAGSNPWFVGAIIMLAIISEMAGVMGLTVGGQRRYDGPMGKSDRAFVFGAVGLLVAIGAPMAGVLDGIWGAMIVLLAITIVNRVRKGLAA